MRRTAITGDARLRFDVEPAAAGYEYSLAAPWGTYQPVATPAAFLPAGLAPGFDTVFVRAFNAAGERGAAEVIAFVDDRLRGGGRGRAPRRTPRRYEYRYGKLRAVVPLGTATAVDPAAVSAGAGAAPDPDASVAEAEPRSVDSEQPCDDQSNPPADSNGPIQAPAVASAPGPAVTGPPGPVGRLGRSGPRSRRSGP